MNTNNFLVVEDDEGVRALIAALLKNAGHETTLCCDGTDAIRRLRRGHFTGIILDLMMPDTNGFEVLAYLAAERAEMLSRTVVITAASDATLRHFDVSGIRTLIHKPFDIHVLLTAVNQIATSAAVGDEMPQLKALDRLH